MHVEVSRIVKAPREKVFAAYTDFEAAPKWSKELSSVKILGTQGNTVRVESGSRARGGRRALATFDLYPPERVVTEGETRLTRVRRAVLLEEVQEGTRVTATLDITVKGRWSWVFSPRRNSGAERSAGGELESFARYVEASP